MSTTDFQAVEYVHAAAWQVRDTCAGSHAVKARRERTSRTRARANAPRAPALPEPASRGLPQCHWPHPAGAVGVVSNWPRFVLPRCQYLADDVNSSGVGLNHQAQSALADPQTRRSSLLADYRVATRRSSSARARRPKPRPGWRVTLNTRRRAHPDVEVQDDRLTRLVLQETHPSAKAGKSSIHSCASWSWRAASRWCIWRQFSDKGKFIKVATYKTTLPSITCTSSARSQRPCRTPPSRARPT